ncbi:Histidine kinase [Rhodovastum atsumiense]|uniref:histidine kinase n=1 Tax=Rhodovastum atsumiense TaxID=504468 RepID=A0A5M6IS85_9PROT|nr:ATP-binding protein [Rhodovastum atsumiense]KAA5611166.1 diguanylate cyclase [Rhodovastum atsumiense]CAH2602528.1 Histidine kinase [Rhodovastum atsumiense]
MIDCDHSSDLEILTDFLYVVPIGLMRFRLDGEVELVNPMVAQMLMPLLPDGDLSNVYASLGRFVPNLDRRLSEFPFNHGIVMHQERYHAVMEPHRVVLSVTIHRVDQTAWIAVIEDVTAQAEQERQLAETKADLTWRRYFDPLTRLPNRSQLELRLAESGRQEGERPTLVFIDIAGVRAIMEMRGYTAGDRLLVEIADRLRKVAGESNFVARLGGTNFVILCRWLGNEALKDLEYRIQEAIAAPFRIEHENCVVSANVAIAPVDQPAGFDLMKAAGKAMHELRQRHESEENAERHRQKMESLGRMMGGVAHEINNMLQPIGVLAEELIISNLVREAGRQHLDVMLECTEKTKEIIAGLLAFSRPGVREVEVVEPAEVLADSLRLARQAIPVNVFVRTEVAGVVPRIAVNRTAFSQIILNLLTNAAAAMGYRGSVRVTLNEHLVVESGHARIVRRPRYVRLRVIDTGCGMNRETLDRVFEPFFTTKPIGQGTGLGLPVVYGLVQEMRGIITLLSEPGQGTTVTILIPVHEDAPDRVGADRTALAGVTARPVLQEAISDDGQ